MVGTRRRRVGNLHHDGIPHDTGFLHEIRRATDTVASHQTLSTHAHQEKLYRGLLYRDGNDELVQRHLAHRRTAIRIHRMVRRTRRMGDHRTDYAMRGYRHPQRPVVYARAHTRQPEDVVVGTAHRRIWLGYRHTIVGVRSGKGIYQTRGFHL